MARPAGLEPAAPSLEVPRKEATGGSAKPLPLILLPFCQTPDRPRLPRAATHCQSFVSRLSPLARTCTLYFSDHAVVCPLCGVTVPKATRHTCVRKP
jgi:hypothetical protein